MHDFARKMLVKKHGATAVKHADLAKKRAVRRGISCFRDRDELGLAAAGSLAAGDNRPCAASFAGGAGGDHRRPLPGKQGAVRDRRGPLSAYLHLHFNSVLSGYKFRNIK